MRPPFCKHHSLNSCKLVIDHLFISCTVHWQGTQNMWPSFSKVSETIGCAGLAFSPLCHLPITAGSVLIICHICATNLTSASGVHWGKHPHSVQKVNWEWIFHKNSKSHVYFHLDIWVTGIDFFCYSAK